nr:hypothetical protein [Tanacetum cinerariifolium]
MQTQTSNTLHNAIMEAGSKNRPPMLAPGNYVQWKSRIKRYIDTKPNQELIHYCLTNPLYELGIDNDIYSTVDACLNSCEMWKAIERSQQAATRNRGKAIVNSPQPIYDQAPSMVDDDDERSKDKKIDKLMALISLSFKKIYKPTNNNLRTSSNTNRANQDNSPRIHRNVGYEHQRLGNVAGARETVGSSVVQKSRIQCYNCKEYGHVARECQKPKRVKYAAYHREKMLLCKQEEAGIQLNAEQAVWKDDTDDESDNQELEAHYMYMAKIQEVSPDAVDSRPIFDREPEQKVDVLTRSSHSSRTSYAVAADLSEMELKKILIDKMEGNKSIQRSDEQRNLYKALIEAYEADKTILDSYRESAILKRRREEDDDQEGSFAGSDRGSKRLREGGEHASASTSSEPATRSAGRSTTWTQSRQMSTSEFAFAEEPVQSTCQMDEPLHLVFETGAEDQPIVQTSQHPEWFSQPRKPPTPDRDWNKTLPAVQGSAQSWISELAKQADARSSFNEFLDTPLDFSNFIMNRLGVDTLTPELLAGPTYELMRGLCNSLTELKYHLEEVYKATMDQLDWVNPEGASSRKYTTSVTKTKATDYGHIKWIEDLVPRTMWIQEPLNYDKNALWGVSHWGRKRQQFYGFAVNREFALDVYSKRRIIAVTDLKIVEWHNYKHLNWISVRRDDDKIYKFKKGDFKRLCLQDIEYMLLLLVQGKLSNLTVEERFAFNVSLRMFIRSIVIQWRVEDLQLGVESYQKRLNLTKPDTYRFDLKRREAYTAYSYLKVLNK